MICEKFATTIKSGPKLPILASDSGPFTEAMLSGVVAMRLGEKLYWDWPQMKVTNHPEAEPLIFPEYHSGWTL